MLKDDQIASLINDLRDISVTYGHTQQLRERIQGRVLPEIAKLKAEIIRLEKINLEYGWRLYPDRMGQ